MTRFLPAMFATVALYAGYQSMSAAGPSGISEVENELLLVQANRFQAMIENDFTALESILSGDLTYTHTTGRVETKAEFLASLQSQGISYHPIEPADVQVRIRDGTAVITGVSAMKVSAGEDNFAFSIRFIEVYENSLGSWRLLAWQSTRLPEETSE